VILGILVFHSIYLEILDKQVEEILEKLKDKGQVQNGEEND
jgi:hypothetical protein